MGRVYVWNGQRSSEDPSRIGGVPGILLAWGGRFRFFRGDPLPFAVDQGR